MSFLLGSLSEDCVNFEKCGDVVVSTSENMIGMFCHFCSDIYTNLSEFLHHLQWMHNDVLKFTKPHNVYSVEELLAAASNREDAQSQANTSSDSGMPADAGDSHEGTSINTDIDPIMSIVNNANILSALESYEVDCQSTDIGQKAESPKNILQANDNVQIDAETRDVMAEVEAQLLLYESQVDEKEDRTQNEDVTDFDLQLKELIGSEPHKKQLKIEPNENLHSYRENMPMVSSKFNSDKRKLTCDYKSYSIARSAGRQKQQLLMDNLKKRILSSLQCDSYKRSLKDNTNQEQQSMTIKTEPLSPPELENMAMKMQSKINVPLTKEGNQQRSGIKMYHANHIIKSEKNEVKEGSQTYLNGPNIQIKLEEKDEQLENIEINNTKKKNIIINKIEIVPKMDLNKILRVKKETIFQPNSTETNLKRRASDTLDSTAPFASKIPARRQSYAESAKSEPIQLDKNANEIQESLNSILMDFNLSNGVEEVLRRDLNNSVVDSDSLLKLAESDDLKATNDVCESILKQISGEQKEEQEQKHLPTKMEQGSAEIEINSSAKELRTDLPLLTAVGLAIIKYTDYEDVKPIELIDVSRAKASKFSNLLRQYETIWNPKKLNIQNTTKKREDLIMLTEEVNSEFKISLDLAEMKRILNLINSWHAQQIDLKFFKKAKLSSTINHYLQLFAFFPKINRCVYYCEWCEESSSNKTNYEKHRLTHQCRFVCPQCKRGFKKQGYLLNHIRSIHGQEY